MTEAHPPAAFALGIEPPNVRSLLILPLDPNLCQPQPPLAD